MIRRLGIIGAGHLAGFVAEGLRRSCWDGDLLIPARGERAEAFAARHRATVMADAQAVIQGADAVLVAVRPAQIKAALAGTKWPEGRQLISAMAGVKIAALQALAPGAKIIRSMPISAATLGASPTPVFPRDEAAEALLARLGPVIPMESEAALEAASANAAAYGWYFRLIARMIAANEATGLAPAEAKRIAVETIRAAAEVALASDAPAEDIIAALATPGGITAQGLEVLEKADAFAPWDGAFAAVAARVKGG